MKRLTFAICIILVLLVCSAFAADNPKVQVNGNILDFTDSEGNKVEAQIINNRTMVPLRKIFEELGCSIEWKTETQTVIATKNDIVITLTIGDNNASILNKGSKEEKIKLDSAPVIVDNRTLVPLRFIGETLGNTVAWDSLNRTAIIIDYEELANVIKDKSHFIYYCIAGTTDISVEKYYYDDWDPSYNSYSKLYIDGGEAATSEDSLEKDVIRISITGDSDFVSEVKEEAWNDFSFDMLSKLDDKSKETVTVQSNNYVFSKMFGKNKNEKADVIFDNYGLSKECCNSCGDYIKHLFNIDATKIDKDTYGMMQKDLNKFAKSFLSGSKKLSQSDFQYELLDLRNIYNARMSYVADMLLVLNKICFRYDFDYQDLFVDYPNISYNFKDEENQITITINMENEYKERIKYVVVLHIQNYI